MSKFYFTFGDNPFFPYQDGWAEVEAPDQYWAVMAYEKFHPKRPGSRFVNCALIYTDREWQNTQMAVNGSNFGAGCHEFITVEIVRISDTFAPGTLEHITAEEKITYRCENLDG